MMLSKPFAGWTRVTVNGEFIGSASYLNWVPGDVLEPCIKYLKAGISDRDGYDISEKWLSGYGLNISFDAEGYHFGIVEIADDFYIFDTTGDKEPYINLRELPDRGFLFVKALMEEAVSDIEDNFEDWVMWDAFDALDEMSNRAALKKILREARKVLNECSNKKK